MAELAPSPKFRAVGSDGLALVGGKLYSYVAGTTTLKTTYTDTTGATANTNPIILDARGECDLHFGTGRYKLVLKDSADVTIWTVDNLTSGLGTLYGTWVVDTFTGDGSTAAFTMTSAPGSVENLQVTLDGLVLTPTTDYTVSGATLTFVTAPPDATQIISRHGQATVHTEPGVAHAEDYGAVGDGVTDDYAALQSAIDDGKVVVLRAATYAVSQPLVLIDGSGIQGVGAHWKARTGYPLTGGMSCLLYTGAGGANTCVVRASATAVGTVGSDFSGPDTDDLVNVTLRDFHIKAAAADYGLYAYRCANGSNVGNVTVEGADEIGIVCLGLFTCDWGTLAAYECGNRGISIGDDLFAWASSEADCFSFKANLIARNNGTGGTFVEDDATYDNDGAGIVCYAGRGSCISITSEANDGRACVLGGPRQYGGGATTYEVRYVEANGAGPKVDYRRGNTAMRLKGGFIHPGSVALASQPIKVVGALNSGVASALGGPLREEHWLVIEGFAGALYVSGFQINSNTRKYKVRDCAGVRYLDKRPTPEGVFGSGLFVADATLSDVRWVKGDTIYSQFGPGNGVTTAYTLPYAPTINLGVDEGLDVYLNADQLSTPAEYTYAGTTLTLVTAPTSSEYVSVAQSNMTLTRTNVGRYQVNFNDALPDTRYAVSLTFVDTTPATVGKLYLFAIANTGFEIRTENAGGALADLGAFILFSVSRTTT